MSVVCEGGAIKLEEKTAMHRKLELKPARELVRDSSLSDITHVPF